MQFGSIINHFSGLGLYLSAHLQICFLSLSNNNQIVHYTVLSVLRRSVLQVAYAGPIFMSLHLGNTASFKEMLQWWRAVCNTVGRSVAGLYILSKKLFLLTIDERRHLQTSSYISGNIIAS